MNIFNRRKNKNLPEERGIESFPQGDSRQRLWFSLGMGAVMALSTACQDEGGDVKSELADLQQAREKAPEVAQEIRGDLQEAEKEVERLSEKLAMAERGITDDVLEEREDVVQALNKKGENVEGNIGEARETAQEFNQAAIEAEQALEETQAGEVEAELQTETRVQPVETDVERTRVETSIPVERLRIPNAEIKEGEEQEQAIEQREVEQQEQVMREESAEPAPVEPTSVE